MKVSEDFKFNVLSFFTFGCLITCFSFGIYLFLYDWNLDIFVKYLLASHLLSFVVSFLMAFLRK